MKKKMGKSIGFFSGKGGVGKTIMTLNLAGIYESLNKKVLIMDMDLSGGNISLSLILLMILIIIVIEIFMIM